MYCSRVLRHVVSVRSSCRRFITPVHAPRRTTRNTHDDVRKKFLPPSSARHLEKDSHSATEYIAFGVILVSIASYALWELSNRDASSKQAYTPLNDRTFVPFLLVAKDQISPTSAIYTIRRGSSTTKEPYGHLWGGNGEVKISSVEFKQPQLQIARAYTPLPPIEGMDPTDLRFLIRRLEGGEVSNYLDGLRVGATIEVRGPRVEWQTTEETPEKVIFLAGGTGIAPAMQLVKSFMGELENEERRRPPKIHILWANRKRDECIGGITETEGRRGWWQVLSGAKATPSGPPNQLVTELGDMIERYDGNLTVDYLVDEENKLIDRRRILRSINKIDGSKAVTGNGGLLMISGPDGFVDYFAGPKAVEGGLQVQGPVRGVIGDLGLRGWTVVKL